MGMTPKVEEDDDEPSVDDYMRKQQILQLQEALNTLQLVETVSQNMFLEQEKKPRKIVTVVNDVEEEAEDIVIDETVENIDDNILKDYLLYIHIINRNGICK